ncbi:heparinase II/III domain-containing protein [Paenibacillus sp. 2KB_22]|uniref:heparinase II/III domain-containing protein n=1 Tax=Paenibacillus sp. 2KB_22 TaxID=3232978 RepID=UPI003F9E7DA1
MKFFSRKFSQNEFKIEWLEIEKITKLTVQDDQTLIRAENNLKNRFFLFGKLDVIDFGEKINWDHIHKVSPNTYQLYLQSLVMISYLTDGYILSKNEAFLKKADSIVSSWMNYNDSSDSKKNRMIWSDHSTADRLINLIYFVNSAEGKVDLNIRKYWNLIKIHCDFLYADKNYVKNNHGVIMDRALFLGSLALDSYKYAHQWRNKAISRLKDAYFRDFSFQGTHLENSPEYHGFVSKLFRSTEYLLGNFGYSLGEEFQKKINLSSSYFGNIAKGNGSLPMIGDTGLHKFSNLKQTGENFLDAQAGIAVLRGGKNTTWVSFVCGYASTTHKHHDDLSIGLFYKGNDVFVDSGKYNHDANDPIRKYIRSPNAHCTIIIKGETYDLNTSFDKIKISGYQRTKYYDLIKGYNNAYDNISIERTIYFFKPEIVLLLDVVVSSKPITVVQNFNLTPESVIMNLSSEFTTIGVGGETVQIIQRNSVNHYEILEGKEDGSGPVISHYFNQTIPTKQVQFSIENNSEERHSKIMYLTEIRLGEAINQDFNSELNMSTAILSVKYNNLEFKFSAV